MFPCLIGSDQDLQEAPESLKTAIIHILSCLPFAWSACCCSMEIVTVHHDVH